MNKKQRLLPTLSRKLKNKRVSVAVDGDNKTVIIRFKRLIDNNEPKIEQISNSTANVDVYENKIVVTTIEISYEAAVSLQELLTIVKYNKII